MSDIIIYVVLFTYFSVKRGGGGGRELSLRFSVFLLHGLSCVLQ